MSKKKCTICDTEVVEYTCDKCYQPLCSDAVCLGTDPHNSAEDVFSLKEAYANQDWEYLRTHLEEEIESLLFHRDTLVPFLKKQGYDDLAWWSL